MHLLAIGLSYKSAPVSLRENLALSPTELEALLDLTQLPPTNGIIQECMIISTCNRLEIIAVVASLSEAAEMLIAQISHFRHISSESFRTHLYQLHNDDAVYHLMRVAAGLDSMVLGEPQILGQLSSAYKIALARNSTKPILSRLCQTAIRAGKRARTETAISQKQASLSSVAVELARQRIGDLSALTVMVLGAGEMGELTVEALMKQGVRSIQVVSRSQESAETLASAWRHAGFSQAQIVPSTVADLAVSLPQADIIIASTGATQPILLQADVARSMSQRSDRPLLIIDIGLPRDVEASAGNIPGIHLFNLDDLEKLLAQNMNARKQEIPLVETIIDQECASFWHWYHARSALPTISKFRTQFEQVKAQEVARTLNRLSHLDQRDQALVSELAHRLVNKFLHHPTVHLKNEAAHGNGTLSKQTLQTIFGLDTDPHS